MTSNPFETIDERLAKIEQKLDLLANQPVPEPTKAEDKYLTAEKVCDLLGITRVTLWSWDKKGLTHPIRLGNLKRYRYSDIMRMGTQSATIKAPSLSRI
ncbi:MAG TPA: hypothetical protein PLV65_12770 [Tenuifilaceae bacterium]|nr:hypothetical protein [Tenuifilaceae bacterium]